MRKVVLDFCGCGIILLVLSFASQFQAESQLTGGVQRAASTSDALTMRIRIDFILEDMDSFGIEEWRRDRSDLSSVRDSLIELGSFHSLSADYQTSVANARGALLAMRLDGSNRQTPIPVFWLRYAGLVLGVVAGLAWWATRESREEIGNKRKVRALDRHTQSLVVPRHR